MFGMPNFINFKTQTLGSRLYSLGTRRILKFSSQNLQVRGVFKSWVGWGLEAFKLVPDQVGAAQVEQPKLKSALWPFRF